MIRSWKASVLALLVTLPVVGGSDSQNALRVNWSADLLREAQRIAETYGLPADEVKSLRDRGLGWGEVTHASAIAHRTNRPASEVLAYREAGLGWGQLAKLYGIELQPLRGKARRLAADARAVAAAAPREAPPPAATGATVSAPVDSGIVTASLRPEDIQDSLGSGRPPEGIDGFLPPGSDVVGINGAVDLSFREARQAAMLSSSFGIPVQDIQDLHDDGMDWLEIRYTLAVAERSQKPILEVEALRDDGLGWGQIAKRLGFALSDVTGAVPE